MKRWMKWLIGAAVALLILLPLTMVVLRPGFVGMQPGAGYAGHMWSGGDRYGMPFGREDLPNGREGMPYGHGGMSYGHGGMPYGHGGMMMPMNGGFGSGNLLGALWDLALLGGLLYLGREVMRLRYMQQGAVPAPTTVVSAAVPTAPAAPDTHDAPSAV